MSAKDAVTVVEGTDDVEILAAMRAKEENRAGGPRKSVLKALADKLGSATPVDGVDGGASTNG